MDNVKEFESIDVGIYENLLHLCEPLVHLTVVLPDIAVLLVGPVGCDTLLCDIIHPPGTDLDFDPDAPLSKDGAVQSFVTVALRMFNPVSDAVGLVTVNARYYGEYMIALIAFGLL